MSLPRRTGHQNGDHGGNRRTVNGFLIVAYKGDHCLLLSVRTLENSDKSIRALRGFGTYSRGEQKTNIYVRDKVNSFGSH